MFVIGTSSVFGAVVNATNGAVLPLMTMYATTNLGPLLEGSGGNLDGTELLPLVVKSGAWWLLVFVLIFLFRRSMVPVTKHGRISKVLGGRLFPASPIGWRNHGNARRKPDV